MFNLILPILAVLVLSCKKERNIQLVVIKDCTCTYLRTDDSDYKLANPKIAEDFLNEEVVIATFKKLRPSQSPKEGGTVCYVTHNYKAWIEVCKIELP